MKKYQYNTSKINKTSVKKREDFLYNSFMVATAVFLFHYIFIESHYIGNDYRYDLFVFCIPTLIGFFVSLKFNFFKIDWRACIEDLKREKNFFYKFFTIPVLILAHLMSGIILFYIPSNIIWDSINKIESNKNPIETYVLTVNDFHHSSGRSGSNRIWFNFKGENESIKTSYKNIKPYLEKKPGDFQVIIELKEGIWNYYILESWDLKKNNNK